MDLKDFVSEALIQITKGVIAAREGLADCPGVMVAPSIQPDDNVTREALVIDLDKAFNPRAWPVKFDVSVTASQQEGKQGGAGIAVLGLGAFGGKKSLNDEHSEISRISFVIPMKWPSE